MLDFEHTLPRQSRPRRVPSRFERWALDPILSFRVGLTLGYVVAVYVAVSALVAGVPAFQIGAPDGWTFWWSFALILSAAVASIGSVSNHDIFRRIELGGAWLMFLCFGVYAVVILWLAYGAGDNNRVVVGALAVMVARESGVRMLWLMSQLDLTGVKHFVRRIARRIRGTKDC